VVGGGLLSGIPGCRLSCFGAFAKTINARQRASRLRSDPLRLSGEDGPAESLRTIPHSDKHCHVAMFVAVRIVDTAMMSLGVPMSGEILADTSAGDVGYGPAATEQRTGRVAGSGSNGHTR
jgi:hypothetical protein